MKYNYVSDDYIDFDNKDMVRWVYIKNQKTKYMVTIYGEIISIKKETKKILRTEIDRDGYHHVIIYINGKPHRKSVHRLVAEAFIPNVYDKPEVNHIDGDKSNNSADNLEWVTTKENIKHAWDNNLSTAKKGGEHPEAVYSEKQIRQVCKMLEKNKKTMFEISDKTGVSYTVVKQIRNHIIWKSISCQYDIDSYNVDGRKRKRK